MCCKPRVLTFDEFLEIPPCTTGKHSTVDDTPAPPKKAAPPTDIPTTTSTSTSTSTNGATSSPTVLPPPQPRQPVRPPQSQPNQQRSSSPAPPPPEEDESDDPSTPIPAKSICKRRSCGVSYDASVPRDDEECTHHPGHPIFHEGSKGWTCCKRRVLEFDEFMKIEGCKKRKRHLFIGKKPDDEHKQKVEEVENVRHDFYQTPTSVIASFFLKKIDKARAKVEFVDEETMDVDCVTTEGGGGGERRWKDRVPLFGKIDTQRSTWRVLGTKLEVTFVKAENMSWGAVRSDERFSESIIQTGRAAMA